MMSLRPPPVTLARLAQAGAGRLWPPEAGDKTVVGMGQDSRTVPRGGLFAALRGQRVDGLAFAPRAVERGAAAVLVEAERGSEAQHLGVPVLAVPEVRRALAAIAAEVYGRPSERLDVIGITGTNGKTSVAHLVETMLREAGRQPGIVGTLGYRLGTSWEEPASHTSPEADALQRVLAEMVDRGADSCAMEVSSIALAADRVASTRFEVAVFTNLSRDHLDYHGTMEAYAAAKERLFFDCAPRHWVVNIDDAHGAKLASRSKGAIRTSRLQPEAEVHVVAEENGVWRIATPADELAIRTKLLGRHNLENLLSACGVGVALGLSAEVIGRGLSLAPPVAGRLERCDDPRRDDVIAVVDYAHTPDALVRILAALRPVTKGALWCVFGCGGDRDRSKRPEMGRAVAEGADHAVLTNDNPRSEDPLAIADEVLAGFSARGVAPRVELDRRRAIEMAVREAEPTDVVLVAGKGHETYQIIGEKTLDFDDREELRRALRQRRGRTGECI